MLILISYRAGPTCQGLRGVSCRGQGGQTHRRHDADEARDGGAVRKRATGHGRGRAWARWRALAPARRTVVVAVPVVAGTDDGELVSGGRSSGAVGIDVAEGLGRR